jgi:hypothetical protein
MKLLCRLFGHKLRFAGKSGEGTVWECVRERDPQPEAYWPKNLIQDALIRMGEER